MTLKKIITTCLTSIAYGLSYGLLISLLMSYCYACDYMPAPPQFMANFSHTRDAMAVSMVIWSMIGVFFGITSLLFTLTHWSLLKRTVVHALITYVGMTIFGCLAGWFPINWPNFLLFSAICIGIYTCHWFIYRHRAKRDIQAINTMLNPKS